MPYKIKAEIDGKEHEIEITDDQLPEGLLTVDQVKATYVPKDSVETTIKGRLSRALKGKHSIEELAMDEEALDDLKARRPDLFRDEEEDEKAKGNSQKQVENQIAKIRATEFEPLRKENDGLKEHNTKLRGKQLDGDVNDAALRLGLKKSMLPLVREFYRNDARTGWSEEHLSWFMKGKDGELVIAAKEDDSAPHISVFDDLASKRKDKDYADWFDGQARSGVDYQGPGQGTGGRTYRTKADFKTTKEKVDFITEYGQKEFDALPLK
jgi:hypothetical protein